jgi:hypothetical protein
MTISIGVRRTTRGISSEEEKLKRIFFVYFKFYLFTGTDEDVVGIGVDSIGWISSSFVGDEGFCCSCISNNSGSFSLGFG